MELGPALEAATRVAREAGELLRADFHRPGGPRGAVDKADADLEAEERIRGRLRDAFPGWSYLGEETGCASGHPGSPLWLVDPNDGTRDYLKGRRGSAVSIGLLHEGRPVLGVVFAFGYPDDAGDLFVWAEGCGPLRRNGRPWEPRLPQRLHAEDGGSRCTRAFGGSRAVAESLARQPWDAVGKRALGAHGAWPFGAGARPRPGETVGDPGLLARAQGFLLGQIAGDSLGALVEFERADDVAR